MRRRSASIALLSFGVVVVVLVAGAVRAADLERDVGWTITHHFRYARKNVAVCVVDPAGRTRVAINADTPMKPASNMKLLPTAAAVWLLGPDYVFETELVTAAPLVGGAIGGDVTLRGTGDPNISGRFYDKPTDLVRRWARDLHGAGVRRIAGDLVVDDSFFDDERFLPGWDRAQAGRWYSAEISPLTFNDNCVDVYLDPTSPGSPARVRVVPAHSTVRIEGAPRTVGGSTTKVRIHRAIDSNAITIGGQIGSRVRNFYDNVAITDPALFFGAVLRHVLEQEDIDVAGRVRRVNGLEAFFAEKPTRRRTGTPISRPDETVLVRHTSALRVDLEVINQNSQNLHAEILLKTLGARAGRGGSTTAGGEVVRTSLADRGLPVSGLEIADGSGLSHENRTSARLLARLLNHMARSPHAALYRGSLATPGEDGTLRKRFRGSTSKVAPRVRAKSGAIRGVSALSGYVSGKAGQWSFSVLVNGFPPRARSAKELQEKIVEMVAKAAE